jgi:hypothetical protein
MMGGSHTYIDPIINHNKTKHNRDIVLVYIPTHFRSAKAKDNKLEEQVIKMAPFSKMIAKIEKIYIFP